MKREFLKELGIDDEVIGKIMAEYGKSVNTLKADADKVDTLEAQINDYKNQLKDRNAQLEELSEKAKGNDELLSQINKLKEENERVQQDFEAKLKQQAFEFSLEKALSDAKAKNPKAVKALLNTEAIKLDGDKLLGLEEQLKSLQESDGYLFGENEPPGLKGRKPHDPNPTDPNSYQGKNPWKRGEVNLSEQGKILREDAKLAKSLIIQAGLNPEQYGL